MTDIFIFTSKTDVAGVGRTGVPQNLIIETIAGPKQPIHDVSRATSLSQQVVFETLWSTKEEFAVEIPCIRFAELPFVREFLLSVGTGSFDYDATNQPFIGEIIAVRMSTKSPAIVPVSKRSKISRVSFVLEPSA